MDSLYSILAVVFVLSLLGGTLAWLRSRGNAVLNFGSKGGAKQMEVMERLTLGPHHTLHLVRVGSGSVVVATSPSGCQFMPEANLTVTPGIPNGASRL